MQNFFDTFGFGVGNGSVRASSILFAIPASLGIVGMIFFSLFFITVFFGGRKGGGSKLDSVDDALRQSARYACVAWFISAATSGAFIDLGLPFFAFAAFASAQPVREYWAMNCLYTPPDLASMREARPTSARHHASRCKFHVSRDGLI